MQDDIDDVGEEGDADGLWGDGWSRDGSNHTGLRLDEATKGVGGNGQEALSMDEKLDAITRNEHNVRIVAVDGEGWVEGR